MSESIGIIERLKHPKAAVAVLLAGLAFAGCGNTKSADTNPLGTCGGLDYSVAETPHPQETVPQALETARQDVLTLQARALKAGGSIDLPRYSGNVVTTTEITASQDDLTLNFARDNGWGTTVDHVKFPVKNGVPQIGEGAVMCFDDNSDLTVNGTFATLRTYVHQTAELQSGQQ